MSRLIEKFIRLKTRVGGNREQSRFEYNFGLTVAELNNITPPTRMNTRILSEVEYALKLSKANGIAYQSEVERVID